MPTAATATQPSMYRTTYSPDVEQGRQTQESIATTGTMNKKEWIAYALNAQGIAGTALSIATAALMLKDPSIDPVLYRILPIATIVTAASSLIGSLYSLSGGPSVVHRTLNYLNKEGETFKPVDLLHTASLATGIASAAIAYQHGSVSEPLAIATMASNAVKFFA